MSGSRNNLAPDCLSNERWRVQGGSFEPIQESDDEQQEEILPTNFDQSQERGMRSVLKHKHIN